MPSTGRRASVHGSRRAPRHLPPLARDRRRLRRAAGARRRGLAARRRAARALPAPGRAAHRLQLRLPRLPVGAATGCARRSRRRSRRTRRSTRRRRGCSRTTTSRGPVTRYGRADTSFAFEAKREGTPTDLERGTRRARAAALLAMALPGSMYVYQGEELGLPEVEDIPPTAVRTRCGSAPAASTRAATAAGSRCRGRATRRRSASAPTARPTWLDQPDGWARLTVEAQSGGPGVDARAVPRRASAAPRKRPGATARFAWLPVGADRARVRARRRASPASSTSARIRSNFRRAPTSSSPATSSKEVRSRGHDGLAPPGRIRLAESSRSHATDRSKERE